MSIVLAICIVASVYAPLTQSSGAKEILQRIDENMSSHNRVYTSTMIIHSKRGDRKISSKSWSEGYNKAFTEYLSPPREKGTKMLKLKGQLWLFSPSTDRTIRISGHMLRQSVMGSDLSYEDMMEDRKLTEIYDAEMNGVDTIDGRACWIIKLTANVSDVAYQLRTMWVDRERYVPLKEELFAKSGRLLRRTEYKNVKKIGRRWFPTTILFKDMLKDGGGTEFNITNIKFDQDIPARMFSKAALRK